MMHQMTADDALSLSMFWAGALMVFTPLIVGGIVLGVWWRQRRAARRKPPGRQVPAASVQERGSVAEKR
jgi:hypothetical protein